jgi:hypothetical protein
VIIIHSLSHAHTLTHSLTHSLTQDLVDATSEWNDYAWVTKPELEHVFGEQEGALAQQQKELVGDMLIRLYD